MSSIKAYYNFN